MTLLADMNFAEQNARRALINAAWLKSANEVFIKRRDAGASLVCIRLAHRAIDVRTAHKITKCNQNFATFAFNINTIKGKFMILRIFRIMSSNKISTRNSKLILTLGWHNIIHAESVRFIHPPDKFNFLGAFFRLVFALCACIFHERSLFLALNPLIPLIFDHKVLSSTGI